MARRIPLLRLCLLQALRSAELGVSKFVYASDFGSGLVRVIDLTKLKVIATIPVAEAGFVTTNARGKLAYVTSSTVVSVIDATKNTVVASFTPGPGTAAGPRSADPVNNLLYVATVPSGGIGQLYLSFLDATTGSAVGSTVTLGEIGAVQALSPSSNIVVTGGDLFGNGYFENAYLVNGTTTNIMDTLDVGRNPLVVAYNNVTKTIYTANWSDSTVSVITY